MRAVELEAASEARLELRRLRAPANGLQGAQVVAGVEVVDPSLSRGFPVVPRPVLVLLGGRIAGDPERRTDEFLLSRVLVHAAEEGGTEKVRVVRLGWEGGERIAESGDRSVVGPIELVQDVLGRAHRHTQPP